MMVFLFINGIVSAQSEATLGHSEFNVHLALSASIMADTVYSYLYKVPVIGRMRLEYGYTKNIIKHRLGLGGGIGRLYSPYASTANHPALDGGNSKSR